MSKTVGDEDTRALAGRYHDENIAPGMVASGFSADVVQHLRLRYVEDVLRNPAAIREIEEWAR